MFNVALIGETELMARLDAMPASVRAALGVEVRKLAIGLQGHIVRDKLHGQVLNQRSGKLARSIQYIAPIEEGDSVSAEVYQSGDVKYSRIHEYGFSGSEQVRAHLRSMVFGRKVDPFSVGPFTRQMNMPARSFMRSSLADMAEQIGKGMQEAAKRGLHEARP